MANKLSSKTISIDGYTEGGSLVFPLSDMVGIYIITGEPVITGSLNLEVSGTALKTHSLLILIRPGATLGELGVFSIEGVSIGVSLKPRLFSLLYDGTAWQVFEFPYAVESTIEEEL